MKLKKTIFAVLIFAIVLTSIGAISAEETFSLTSTPTVTVTADNSPITVTATADDNITTADGNSTNPDNGTVPGNTTPQTGIQLDIEDFGIVMYGTPYNMTVNAKNLTSNSSLVGQHVSLELTRLTGTIASKTYDTVTDYEGKAKLPITLAPGTYSAKATFENYTATRQFTIYRDPTFFIQSNFEVNRKGERYITRLYSLSGATNVVAGETISLTFSNGKNSKTYTQVTDANGMVAIPINFGTGTYTVTSEYAGTGAYSGCSQTNNITIYPESHKMPSIISVIGSEEGVLNTTRGTAINFRLTENNGLLMPQSTITVTLSQGSRSKTYTLNTGSSGQATLPLNLGAGEYTITSKYSGSYYFSNTTTVTSLIVNG